MAEANIPKLVSFDDDEDGKKELSMPNVPRDWEFNDLLANLANEMTDEDLKEAKTRFSGEEGLGKRVLSNIQTPDELFTCLQQRTFLDRNNLLFLQALLYRLGRMDLYDMAIEYAVSVGDVIYFSQPPDEPANGYSYVKFHIEGTDFKKIKRSCLETMRSIAARLMFVPPEYVIIAGVEPSSSFLVTLMVPKRFIKYLEKALKKTKVMKELTDQGIDIVRLCDTTVNLHGVEDADIIETEEQTKLKTIYEQLQYTKGNLEEREIECLQLQRKLNEKRNKQADDEIKASIIKLYFEANLQQKIPRLSKQSAYAFFKHCLNLVKEQKYNREIIETLLDAQACVISARIRDREEIRIKAFLLKVEELKTDLFSLQIFNARLQNWSAFDDKEFLKSDWESLLSIILQQGIQVTRTLGVHPAMVEILRQISGLLRAEDKKLLLGGYEWPDEEDISKRLRRDKNELLVCLWAKEVIRTGKHVDLMEFILRKLTEVKREDLKIIFTYLANGMNATQPATPAEPQQAKSSKEQPKSYKHQSKTGKDHHAKASSKSSLAQGQRNIEDQVDLILKKVANIEEMILAAQTSNKASTFGSDVLQSDLLSKEFKHDPRLLFGRYGTPTSAGFKSAFR